MFELPEMLNFARQMNEKVQGRTIRHGRLGNSPHKFLWTNRSHEAFAALTADKRVGESHASGKWLFVPLEPGYVLLLGECGGRLLFHQAGAAVPKKYHLYITFTDGSFLTAMTQMWGAMELYEAGQEQEREYVKGMRPTPVDAAFTADYFCGLVAEVAAGKKRSVKGLLTQDQLIPGLGNAIAQDILFHAGLHPRHDVADLDDDRCRALYRAIKDTVDQVVAAGGRYDEVDLMGRPGGYVRLMDRQAVGRPCPRCGSAVEKIQYLGGACYLCPACQT